ncbi:hypothetical protein H312_02025, partial [Anncaliia algerae PRA339]
MSKKSLRKKIVENYMEDSAINSSLLTMSYLNYLSRHESIVYLEYVATLGLIKNERSCPACNNNMRIVLDTKRIDSYAWTCKIPCRKTLCVRKDSIFEHMRKGFHVIFLFLRMWIKDDLQGDIAL